MTVRTYYKISYTGSTQSIREIVDSLQKGHVWDDYDALMKRLDIHLKEALHSAFIEGQEYEKTNPDTMVYL